MSQAGDFDNLISVERSSSSADGVGGISLVWAPVGDVWAKVVPESARIREQAGRIAAPASYTVTIRQPFDIMGYDRILWNGGVYSIIDFVPAPRRAAEQSFQITLVLP